MWLDRCAVLGSDGRWPPGEQQVAALVSPVIVGFSPQPRMVIDCRPPSARIAATSTYRLLSALRLDRAAPVAVSATHVLLVYQALESMLRVCPGGGPALAIGMSRDTPTHCRVACCLLCTAPATTDSISLEETRLPETGAPDAGFVDLVAAILPQAGNRNAARKGR